MYISIHLKNICIILDTKTGKIELLEENKKKNLYDLMDRFFTLKHLELMLFDISHIQYLHDSKGKPTAVQIPINDWKAIEQQVLLGDIQEWQKKILDERLAMARKHPEQLLDFDTAMLELENETD